MVFQVDPRGKLWVVMGYPDPEIAAQHQAIYYPDSIFFEAELTTDEE